MARPASRRRSTVSVVVATAIVVADMIGVGVFTSLGFQVKDIPSGFSILLLWTVGGIVALCGVFSYSELGAMFPRSSGEYNFLSRAFHPAFGFLAGWVSATVGFAAPVALAAMAFGEYGKSVLPGAPPLALAVGVVWLVSIVQLAGVRHSSTFQLISTILKVVLITAFLIAGFVVGTPQPVSFAPQAVRLRPHRQRAVRDRARVRDVFVLRVERGDLHHRRDAHAAAEPAARAAGGDADRAGAVCGAECGVPAHHADRQAVRAARRRPHRRQPYLRRHRRPHRRRHDLHRAGLLDQRDDVDRPARDDDDGGGHPGAADVRPQIDPGRAGLCHPVPARGREPDAVHPQFRGGAGFHPVRAAVLLVLHRARRHQAAHHAARCAATLPRLGIPDHAAGFPARDRLHDVLSLDGAAVAVRSRYFDHDFGPLDLCRFPQRRDDRATSLRAANRDASAHENCRRRCRHAARGRAAGAQRRYRHRQRYRAVSGGHAAVGRFTADCR